MCTNTRLIRNAYTGKAVRVSCGKCEACRQQKAAARANRIRNHSRFGYVSLFVTLTYSNDYLPYIKRSDLNSEDTYMFVPVYRNKSVRKYRDNLIVSDGLSVIDDVYVGDFSRDLSSLPSPTGMDKDKLGVIYYPDLQDFIKRLRINLKRSYDYHKRISYFACSELGSCTKRPHFHLLIFVPTDDVQTVQSAIMSSWSFADKARTKDYIEIAKNAASYVASYVNSSSSFPDLVQKTSFKPTHSYSKDFGVLLDCFSLSSLLEKVRRGDLSYNVGKVKNGIPCVSSVPVPQYIINRFFPKFKGYSLLVDSEIHKLLLRTSKLARFISEKDVRFKYSSDDEHKLFVRLLHIRDIFKKELGWSFQRFSSFYPKLYTSVWNCYHSTCYRLSFNLVANPFDWLDFYENSIEVIDGVVDSDFLKFLDSLGLDSSWIQLDPNKRKDIVNQTSHLTDIFYKMDKNKRVVNFAMSRLGHNV